MRGALGVFVLAGMTVVASAGYGQENGINVPDSIAALQPLHQPSIPADLATLKARLASKRKEIKVLGPPRVAETCYAGRTYEFAAGEDAAPKLQRETVCTPARQTHALAVQRAWPGR